MSLSTRPLGRIEDRKLECDWCNDRANPVRGPFLSCTTGFTIANRPPQTNDGVADTECSMCFGDLEMGEALFKHDVCQHTWHQSCVDDWVDTSIQNATGPTNVTCGMCRGPIMSISLPPWHIRRVTYVPHGIHEDMAGFVAFAGAVDPVPRDHMAGVVQRHILNQPEYVQFLREQIGVDTEDGPYPSYSLTLGPRTRPGSEIFNRVEYVQGGAVSVRWCDHFTEYFFMGPEAYYNNICALFTAGWSPVDGGLAYFQVQPRQPPRRLPDLLMETQYFMLQNLDYYGRWNNGDKAVEIFHVQVQSFFLHSVALSGRVRLYLRVIRPSGLPEQNAGTDITMGNNGDDDHDHDHAHAHAHAHAHTHNVVHDIQDGHTPAEAEWHDDWQVKAIAWSESSDGPQGRATIFTDDETRALVESLGGVGDGFTLILKQYQPQETEWLWWYIERFRQVRGRFGDLISPNFEHESI